MVYKIKPAAAVSTDFEHLLAADLGADDSIGEAYERAAMTDA